MRTEPLTVGGLHHMSIGVPDVDAAARMYETAMGWRRLVDLEMDPPEAATVGRLLGLERLDSAHVVILQSGDLSHGMIEFVELGVERETSPVPSGLLAMSYLVEDPWSAMRELVDGGFEAVCEPVAITAGAWSMVAGTLRGRHAGLIEIIKFGRV